MKKIFLIPFLLMAIVGFYSCENQDVKFHDFDYSTVYFAYQTPVRTLTMGEDIFDTSLDNLHKCKIMATVGGMYTNNNNVLVDISVDNTLCAGLLHSDNTLVEAMPSTYYKLASNQIVIPKGSASGGVEVQLTDAFFADPLAITKHYVIPVVINSVQNVDSILSGKAKVANPVKSHLADWEIQPKNYIMYAVKYINTWTGNYLRRGVDVQSGTTSLTTVRHKQYVEKDEVCAVSTRSLSVASLPIVYKDAAGNNQNVTLLFTFDNSGNCTVSSGTANVAVSGTGKFVKKGEKKSWGNTDRDALYLNYSVDMGTTKYVTTDTLVARDRGVAMETFSYTVQ